ncbi:MAG: tRNA (adenosine(37)-N6)-dimethylallyltransferase MiaA, partial [Defluviitaleaceae bacterium]|nr:tRNA (adenosine(37)-N6)-dimethylallyltransferase MiaA [Defluviitaleaceae bacterium]
MDKLIIVAGPTASGKTAVAVALAKLIGGEVVSADSMQIYTGMDIGTAKPTMEEQDNIPHHMIDIIKPDEPYSAALYQQQARAVIKEIHARGRVPILCGGTGFYINAVQNDVRFADDTESNNPPDFAMREHFANIALEHGREQLHTMLHKADPMAAKTIHANNIKRVSRALSYIHTTGQLFSEYNAVQKV